jgi:hypothetical protein
LRQLRPCFGCSLPPGPWFLIISPRAVSAC